jgi:sigma-B regulation protein RsbU (phosphoserine phosphatase)
VTFADLNRDDVRRWFQHQQLLVFVAVALFVVFSAVGVDTRLRTIMVFFLCVGNLMFPVMSHLERYYVDRPFPFNWLVHIPLLTTVSIAVNAVATGIACWLLLPSAIRAGRSPAADFRIGTLITIIVGVVIYLYHDLTATLDMQNRALQQAVRTGEARLGEQERELQTAREIQLGLIPTQIPQLDKLQITASWEPARIVGGDYFDVIKLNPHRMAICIADVVGKGIAAALLMANVQAGVKAFATENASPSDVCERLNRVMWSNLAPEKFVTLFYCVIDTEAATLSYCNAGHWYPLLARSTGEIERCREGGTVLGVWPDSRYDGATVRFRPGDRILLFTDGITEATNASGEEYGDGRLCQQLASNPGSKITALHSALMNEVAEFCGREFVDDATLVLISFAASSDASTATVLQMELPDPRIAPAAEVS